MTRILSYKREREKERENQRHFACPFLSTPCTPRPPASHVYNRFSPLAINACPLSRWTWVPPRRRKRKGKGKRKKEKGRKKSDVFSQPPSNSTRIVHTVQDASHGRFRLAVNSASCSVIRRRRISQQVSVPISNRRVSPSANLVGVPLSLCRYDLASHDAQRAKHLPGKVPVASDRGLHTATVESGVWHR